MTPTTITHCERPGCRQPLGDVILVIDGQTVCHRHSLHVPESPPPPLSERLRQFKEHKRAAHNTVPPP